MKAKAMQKTLSGLMVVASFVFLMAIIGGVQKGTIDIIPSFFYIFGSFLTFLAGFILLCKVEK